MATENKELMHQARLALQGKWGVALAATMIYIVLLVVIQMIPVVGKVAGLFVGAPLVLGMTILALNIARNKNAEVGQLFEGFNKYGTALGAYFLMFLFVLLWALLLIIPGIIAGISYSQTFYIIADDEQIGPMEAIDKSKAMMDGYKMKYFRLMLRFFGLALLCLLTLGIGFFWLASFMHVTLAKFYQDIKGQEEDLDYGLDIMVE